MLLSSRLKCWIALSTIVLKWRVLSTFLSSGSRPLVWKLIITCTCIKEILLVNNIEAHFIDIIVALILWQRVVPTYRYWELANQTSPVIKRMSYSELSSHITLFLKCYMYAWQWWFFSSKLIFSIHVIVHFFIIWSTLVTKPSCFLEGGIAISEHPLHLCIWKVWKPLRGTEVWIFSILFWIGIMVATQSKGQKGQCLYNNKW